MKLSNSFRIDRPSVEVFDAFLDIEQVAGCMPGSRILGKSADDTYDGEVKIKVGPLAVAYSGQLHVLNADRERLQLTMRAKGREQRGAGNADAHVVTQLSAQDGGTLVEIDTDLNIRGKAAQFGHGVITEVSDDFMQTFAANLETMLAGTDATASTSRSGQKPYEQNGATQRIESGAAAADERAADEHLDAWQLIVRPMVKRYASSVVIVTLFGAAAYLGARIGARQALLRNSPRS